MNMSKVKKIAVILLILGLIFIKIINPTVMAEEIDLNNLFGNEIGTGSELNPETNNEQPNNDLGNTNVNTNTNTQVSNKPSNTNNSALPKTGTSENVLIGLMGICAISAIYAYNKVKEYNM